MSIAFDSTAQGKSGSGSTNLTYSHTCAGSNRILVVGVVANDATDTVTGVTFNTIALTKIGSAQAGSGSFLSLWYLIAPATGAHNIVISRSANTAFIYGASISLTGVQQSLQPDANGLTASSGSTTTRTATATALTAGSYAIAVGFDDNGGLTAGTNCTLRGTIQDGGFGIFDSSGFGSIPAGSFSMTITGSNGGQAIGMGIFKLNDFSFSVTDSATTSDTIATKTGAYFNVSDKVKVNEKVNMSQTGTTWSNPSKSTDKGWTNPSKS